MNKGGVSEVIANLLIILFVIISVGILFIVIRNAIGKGAEDVNLDQFLINIKIDGLSVSSDQITLNLKRDAGVGNLSKLKFVVFDGKKTSSVEKDASDLTELNSKSFILSPDELDGVFFVKEISIFPVISKNNREKIGNELDKVTIDTIFIKGLKGHWEFDEGSGLEVKDSSKSGYNGTLVNGTSWVLEDLCVKKSCLKFDGINDYVHFGTNDNFSYLTQTISLWIKPGRGQGGNDGRILQIGNFTNINYEFALLENSQRDNKIEFLNWNGYIDSPAVRLTSISNISTNDWTNIVVVVGNSDNRLYVNGVLEASSNSAPIRPAFPDFLLGSNVWNVWFFNGTIDEIRIYNRSLLDEEIKTIYEHTK